MWVINVALLLLFTALFFYCLKTPQEEISSIDKKEHRLYLFYPMAKLIYDKTGIGVLLREKRNTLDSIKALYLTGKPELHYKLFWYKRFSQVILVLVLFNLLSLFGQLEESSNSVLIDGKYIKRPDYGMGSSKVELKVSLDQQLEENVSALESQEVTIDVGERIYRKEEIKDLFAKAIIYLNKEVLGNNKSFELIDQNLNFCTSIPGTSIKVDWNPEDYNLIQSDGTVCNTKVGSNGMTTKVIAILSYYEEIDEETLIFKIVPRQYSKEELIFIKLKEEIIEYADKTAVDKLLELPTSLENLNLKWEGKKSNSAVSLLLLGIILSIVVWIFGDKELDKQMKRRKEQMLLDYPEIINKFTLLVNAGMTIKQAWIKITEDYINKNQEKGFHKRYAYEEMLTTAHEIKLGIPEHIAYEQYGRRTGLIPYIKFSSLITQNLKKGTKGFTDLLIYEAVEAFENRKEIAKRLGEEAGTKLLLPMMAMLIMVLLIIMIPAFMAF